MSNKTMSMSQKKKSLSIKLSKQSNMSMSPIRNNPPVLSFSNKYKLEVLLGTGAFGEVYLAKTLSTGDPVAIKLQKTSVGKEMFTKEINTLKQILPECKKLLCIIDSGVLPDGTIYIVTEYIKGDSLSNFLERNKNKLDANLKEKLCNQLITGMFEMHKLKVFHSDLKPDNIMVEDGTNDLKIIDFGLACDYQNICGGGTPIYMSPDYFLNYSKADHQLVMKNDIYAVGLILYEIYYEESILYLFNVINKNFNLSVKDTKDIEGFYEVLLLISASIREKIIKNPELNHILLYIVSSLTINPERRLILIKKWEESL